MYVLLLNNSRVFLIMKKYEMYCKVPLLFKITNENENHKGFQYYTGLNILNEPFESEGHCVKGGIYFTDKNHILDYLSYGDYLREVILQFNEPNFMFVRDGNNKKLLIFNWCKKRNIFKWQKTTN